MDIKIANIRSFYEGTSLLFLVNVYLFFANILLVLLNYHFTFFNYPNTPLDKNTRFIFFLISVLVLIGSYIKLKIETINILGIFIVIFIGAIINLILGKYDEYSISRTIVFLFPVLYTVSFINLLIRHSNQQLEILLRGFQLVYSLPILIYLLDSPFQSLYIGDSSICFMHNHYGWASLIFMLTSADLFLNYKNTYYWKILTVLLFFTSIFLFFACNNRATWVSGGLSLGVFIFKNTKIKVQKKYIFTILLAIFSIPFFWDKSSSFYHGLDRTIVQIQYGKETSDRLRWQTEAYKIMIESPENLLLGQGLFYYKRLENKKSLHNSYLDILYGSGLIFFSLFTYFMVINPLLYFWNYLSSTYITFFPLLLIPYFENNLTGGQFLFYPWFGIMSYYSLKNTKNNPHYVWNKLHSFWK